MTMTNNHNRARKWLTYNIGAADAHELSPSLARLLADAEQRSFEHACRDVIDVATNMADMAKRATKRK
jgi:hypothetical protein